MGSNITGAVADMCCHGSAVQMIANRSAGAASWMGYSVSMIADSHRKLSSETRGFNMAGISLAFMEKTPTSRCSR
jgi:hypothetical protein